MNWTRLLVCLGLILAAIPAGAEDLYVTPSARSYQESFEKPQRTITSAEIARSSAKTLDEVLRIIPGFGLFRRSSSDTANPTTQGANLRGIGPSAASRVLVLLDDEPLGDPFGGWINWSKVPLEDIERIEVYRGGGTQHYGNFALGGVIKIISKPLNKTSAELNAEIGNHDTEHLNIAAIESSGPLAVAASGRYFDTGGYYVVAPENRGAIDRRATSRSSALRLRASAGTQKDALLKIAALVFDEHRSNGTPLTDNQTQSARFSVSLEREVSSGTYWKLQAYNEFQTYKSRFSSQAEDRNSERPALDQFSVPSRVSQIKFTLQSELRPETILHGGIEFSETTGETNEKFLFEGGRPTRSRQAGGTERIWSIYAAAQEQASESLSLGAALRFDYIQFLDGFSRINKTASGEMLTQDRFNSRSDTVLSPRIHASYEPLPGALLHGSAYHTMRVPTLNELYRPFRVRNDITTANANLDPETLIGVDVGASFSGSGLGAAVTFYSNWIRDLIANASVGRGPGEIAPCGFVPLNGVCRQRVNLDQTLVFGIEAEASYSPAAAWLAELQYAFSETEILDAGEGSDLNGKELAQVPQHSLSAALTYDNADLITTRLQARYTGKQYEDDLNTLTLDDFITVDVFLSRRMGKNTEILASVQNLFDAEIETAKTADGITSIGSPLSFTLGLRTNF